MRRRALLGATVATSGGLLAGCLGSGDDRPTVTDADAAEHSHSFHLYEIEWDLEVPDQPTALATVRVGESDDHHHHATVLAEEPTETTIAVFLAGDDDEPLYETTAALETDSYVGIRFEHPADYVLECRTDAGFGTVDIDASYVDCNSSNHALLVRGDGSVGSASETTLVEC